ncbi:MAG: hypothetical protein ETSY2_35895 [Candidatus Entotheonella gemina]|uniref:Uncharacterized protein n=1 Tax=Candidatus Entotheonella gemina TaxID=1429439 RepID=W4LWI9_9BACT|nr:MAG: hypothetical protein ETSY2_35895 [Candidatus Entotheonella gemina]
MRVGRRAVAAEHRAGLRVRVRTDHVRAGEAEDRANHGAEG